MKRLRAEKGQALMESLLLMALFLAATLAGFRLLRDQQLFERAFASPWVRLQNIIHYGVNDDNEQRARTKHPANVERHLTRIYE